MSVSTSFNSIRIPLSLDRVGGSFMQAGERASSTLHKVGAVALVVLAVVAAVALIVKIVQRANARVYDGPDRLYTRARLAEQGPGADELWIAKGETGMIYNLSQIIAVYGTDIEKEGHLAALKQCAGTILTDKQWSEYIGGHKVENWKIEMLYK